MADHQKYHFQLFLLISSCFVLSSYGFQFNVGGRQGWVVDTSENYNDWAGRLRFQINDTLLFKYSKGDSVLVVNKDDYDKCNTDKPIMKFDDGNSVFKFDRSGPFYFITGNKSNCENGQKMIVVVLAIRSRSPLPSPPGYSPMPSPPISPSPSSSGGSATPALSPSVVPTPAGSAMSPSPSSQTPVPSPEGLTPAPAMTPTSSSPSPSSPPSPLSPSTSPAGSPGLSPSGGGGSRAGAPGPNSGNTPSDIRSPTDSPAGSSATLAFTPTSAVLFSSVSFVLCGLVIFI